MKNVTPTLKSAAYHAEINARTTEAKAIAWRRLLKIERAPFLFSGGSELKSINAPDVTATKPAKKRYGFCETSRNTSCGKVHDSPVPDHR